MTLNNPQQSNQSSASSPVSKAEQTRQHILSEALFLATSKSLNDVTIGSLAKQCNLSKSGLYAHFGSKENLQVAIVDYASEIFSLRVVKDVSPALAPIDRITALVFRWLNWFEDHAKQCLFMSATLEFNDRPGPVKDALHRQINRWINYLESIAAQAIDDKSFRSDCSPQQFVYEIYSLFLGSQKFLWLQKESAERELFSHSYEKLIRRYSI